MEVSTLVIILQLNDAVQHLGTLEQVKSRHVELLLEGDVVLLGQAPGLGLGLALDGEAEGLVVGEPDVVLDEGVHVGDGDLLGDVDLLVLVRGGLGEFNGGEDALGLDVGQVHLAGEAVNVSVDGAVGGDGGVDLHGVRVGLGVEDVDALDLELGLVHLALGNLGHTNKDAIEAYPLSEMMIWVFFFTVTRSSQGGHLH